MNLLIREKGVHEADKLKQEVTEKRVLLTSFFLRSPP
jgi:hypothetical protein